MTQLPLLTVEQLVLGTSAAMAPPVVDCVSLTLRAGERIGIVGRSGSGKSMLMRAVIGLLPPGIVRRGGSVRFAGRDMSGLAPDDLRKLRGKSIGLIFQEPMTSLNPALTIGRQMEEGLALHTTMDASARQSAILAMLKRVGIADPDAAVRAFPHEFSGGMRQRIMIASVMLLEPALLIADEPTTALDAVVQRDVLELLHALVEEKGTAMVLISHDMAMVAQYTDRVLVMQKGVCVEEGTTAELLRMPRHDYTRKLLSALPRRAPARAVAPNAPLASVRNMKLAYGSGTGAKPVLHGIDLDIHPGEIVALVGGPAPGRRRLAASSPGCCNRMRARLPSADRWSIAKAAASPTTAPIARWFFRIPTLRSIRACGSATSWQRRSGTKNRCAPQTAVRGSMRCSPKWVSLRNSPSGFRINSPVGKGNVPPSPARLLAGPTLSSPTRRSQRST